MTKDNEKVVPLDLTPRIAVIGVGGAGGNAVNNMIAAGLEGVTFIVANTDAQALAASEAEEKIQLGVTLTEGLGAGSKPEIGAAAAEEAVEEIRAQIKGCHMVFVAAGMGGGTGTGAAGVIARIAHELEILTVGVVTKPFHFEGNRRMRSAEAGIAELAKHVDTLIAIPNQNLFRVANEKTTFAKAFEMADQVLHAGISCVTDLIVREGLINLDFADVRAIMMDMGAAMMGTGEAAGENRAVEAAEFAIANPLLDDVTLKGARGLLVSISGSEDLTLFEVDQAANRIREEVDPDANIIVGANFDHDLDDRIRVSIVASGLRSAAGEPIAPSAKSPLSQQPTVPTPLQAAQPQRPAPMPQQGAPRQAQQPQSRTSPPQAPAQRPTTPQPTPKPPVQHSAPQHAQRPPVAQHKSPSSADKRPSTSQVQIEVGPPRMLTAGTLSRPLATGNADDMPATAQAAFVPQASESVRRTPPRMPEIEDFPPVAQRELREKSGQTETSVPKRRRSRLFDRLKGAFEDGETDEVTDLKDISVALENEHPDVEQDVEIPGFFKRQVGR